MTVKSIVEIDVNDQSFKNFQALHAKYQEALKKSPAHWQKVTEEIGNSRLNFSALVADQIASLAKTKLIAAAAAEAARQTRTVGDRWKDMSRDTRDVAGNISKATTSLLKWTALTGVFSGILGAGGLFGIDRLAAKVSDGRRSSLGTGSSYGERRSFALNYGRVVDPESFLGNVNEALHDVTKRSSLYGAGLNESDLGGSTAQVAVKYLAKMKELADQTPDSQLAQVLQARRGNEVFGGLEDFQRLKATPRSELNDYAKSLNRDRNALGLDPIAQKQWQDFNVQLDRAGSKIENVFVKGLTPLAKPLSDLSDSVSKTVETLLLQPHLKDWIIGLGTGLEKFAGYVGTDEFQDGVKKFADGVVKVGNALARFSGWLGKDGPPAPPPTSIAGRASSWWTDANPKVKPGAGHMDHALGALAADLQAHIPGINQVTSFNDNLHARSRSAHADNRAFDVNIKDPSQSAAVADEIRAELRRMGITGRVIDEYKNPSPNATGGHIHVQTDRRVDVRIFDSTGGNVVVQTNQVA
jgi:hypothetical protein